jgi:hypothetical protein
MVIRKISVGPDYKNSMHYTVGQRVLNDNYSIHLIKSDDLGNVSIFIESNSNEVVLWKMINCNTPYQLEANIEF